MLGTGLQFRRARGEDRFYVPVKARKNQNQMQRQSAVRSKNDESESPDSKRKPFASENGDSTEATNAVDKSSVVSRSNLDRFLDSTTPSVEAHYLSKVYKSISINHCSACRKNIEISKEK